jgi:hypothetical protein
MPFLFTPTFSGTQLGRKTRAGYIYGLFNYAASDSEYLALNASVIIA